MGTFQIGDIVEYKSNPELRYIVVSLSSISGMPTWLGISEKGKTNGGTIEGSWDFNEYRVIGHYPIEDLFNYIKTC